MIRFERRASTVLYHLLRSLADERPFLLPANVCPVVPETFLAAGRNFEPVDIAFPSLEMDPEKTVQLLEAEPDAYSGVLFVRTYGSERDPSAFFAALRAVRPNLFVIDDKCLCRPDCAGASLSALADVTLFSTGYAKYVDRGQGGFAHTRDDVAYHRMPAPEWLDLQPPDETWTEYSRLTALAARQSDEQKAVLNAIYSEALPRAIQLSPELQRWRFNIRVPDADGLVARIFESGLFASRHYPALNQLPNATRLHDEVVNLFNDRYFDADRARRVSEIILRHLDATTL